MVCGPLYLGHANELGQTFIHGINRQTGWLEPIAFLESRNIGLMRNAPHQKPIGRLLIFEQW